MINASIAANPELLYLVLTALSTGFMWLPYLADAAIRRGTGVVLSGAPQESDVPLSGWARRFKEAHRNTVENLVLFAPLVLTTVVLGRSSEVTTAAVATYFWARIAYYFLYGFGVPYLRTVSFLVGWSAVLAIAWRLLAMT